MWYEIIPPSAAIIFLTYLPNVLVPLGEEWLKGNRFYKNTDLSEVEKFWWRDLYLTGNGNIPTRVDAIPDLPDETNKTE